MHHVSLHGTSCVHDGTQGARGDALLSWNRKLASQSAALNIGLSRAAGFLSSGAAAAAIVIAPSTAANSTCVEDDRQSATICSV
jgi:hypothetical protein